MSVNVKKLIKALESGEYVFGKNHLEGRTPSQKPCFCTMGVACLLAEKEGVEVNRINGRIAGDELTQTQLPVYRWLTKGVANKSTLQTEIILTNDRTKTKSFDPVIEVLKGYL